MSKHKHSPHHAAQSGKQNKFSQESLAERGHRAFQLGRLDQAIELWERAAKKHPDISPALAEAYFRHALTVTASSGQKPFAETALRDLQRATELQPNDAIYYYHLALAHHRRGELDAALIAYEITAGLPNPPRGLASSISLARLETDANFDPMTLPGLDDNEHTFLDTLARLLRGDTSFVRESPTPGSWFQSLAAKFSGADPKVALLSSLTLLNAGNDAEAQNALESTGIPAAVPHAQALRHYYLGVLAARRGDASNARVEWEQARARGLETPWLGANLATAHLPAAISAVQAENWNAAVEHARAALRAEPKSPAAAQLAVIALNHLARKAAHDSKWSHTANLWREAREIHSTGSKTDRTTRALLQNLAISSERAEAWEQAAQSWRDLLRTKPRSKKANDPFSGAQWQWIRRRAIFDLQKAGQLAQAITLLKQKIKAEPNDIPTRLELVEALTANEQESAAGNELQRILQIDLQHTAARMKLAEWHARREEWYAAELAIQPLIEQDPTNAQARRQLAYLMLQRGRTQHTRGQVAAGRAVLEEALTYGPDDADIYIELGRADLDLDQLDAARADFEQAYRVGEKKATTHEQIVQCWIMERQRAEVEKAVARAESEFSQKLDPLFYVHSGLACFSSSPFDSARTPRKDQAWENFGKELIERGVNLKPNDPELLQHVVSDCLEAQLPIGAPYAERLTRLTPNDPMGWITLGLLRAMAGDTQPAKENLKQGARLARQQGLHDIEQGANEMRRQLDNPLLSLMSGLGVPLGALLDLSDEAEGEDAEEIFEIPPRRRRR